MTAFFEGALSVKTDIKTELEMSLHRKQTGGVREDQVRGFTH